MAAWTSKSNFTHEVEQFEDYNGETDNKIKYNLCPKNPGHEKFKSVCDLKMEDVPLEFQTDEGMDYIHVCCIRTVKLTTKFISYGREGLTLCGGVPYPYSDGRYKGNTRMVRNGTGYIYRIRMFEDEPCECKECKNSTHPVVGGYMEVSVSTARHVVFDESECVHTTVEVFYDTPGKNGVVLLDVCDSLLSSSYGPVNDRIDVFCYTHDKDVMDKLINKIGLAFPGDSIISSKFKSGFTVSHPHGFHKQISFGQTLFFLYSFRKDHPEPEGFVRCRLKLELPLIQRLFSHVSKIFWKKENKLLENVTSPSMVEPGVEYLLPDTSNICVPAGYHEDLHDWLFGFEWYDIPEGFGYTDSNEEFVHFPPGMEILCKLEYQFSLTYDIPTCPGSSGARVYNCGGWIYPECVHSGEIDEFWGNQGIYGI